MIQNSSTGCFGPDTAAQERQFLFRDALLRSTLLGEYISLLIFCHAMISGFTWSLYVSQTPVALLMLAAGLWVGLRMMGGWSGETWTMWVSTGLLVLLGAAALSRRVDVPEWMLHSVVAPVTCVAAAGLTLVLDFLEWYRSSLRGLSQTERRPFRAQALKRLLVGIAVIWSLGVPVATSLSKINRVDEYRIQLEEPTLIEHIGLRSAETLVTMCFLAIGCTIGSFLNVVVWRMPQGRSVVYESSSCPACGTAIEGRDNIPVFGWLRLGGRCRNCRADIAPRYPTVEAVTGGLFLLFYFVELISGGANLPFRPVNSYRGVLWIVMYAKWDLIGLYLYHCFLMSSLLVWALMSLDGQKVPGRLLVFTFLTAIVAPFAFPDLALVSVLKPFTSVGASEIPSSQFILFSVTAGAAAGLLMGLAVNRLLDRCFTSCRQASRVIRPGLMLVGVTLGWQAVVVVSVLFCLITAIRQRRVPGFERMLSWYPESCDLLAATVLHQLLWRLLWQWISM